MATLASWFQSGWVGNMGPGQVHGWIAWGGGLQPSDVIEIMAHPVVGNPNAGERTLEVISIQAEGTSDGTRRIFFDIKNVSQEWIPGYSMTGMTLRP